MEERVGMEGAAFSQSFTLNIPYLAAPGLDSISPFHPGHGASALAESAEAQARAHAIARQGGGGSQNRFNTVLDPSRMIQVDPERMAEFATRSAAYNADRACLMALGVEMMARNGSAGDTTPQVIAQIGAECSRSVDLSDAQALDACMQTGGDRHAMAPPDSLRHIRDRPRLRRAGPRPLPAVGHEVG